MADHAPDGSGFLSRWSRRKVQVRQGVAPAEPVAAVVPPPGVPAAPAQPAPAGLQDVPATVTATAPATAPAAAPAAPPAPTLADVAALTRDSDYTRFVAPGVDSGVKNAALKKLFTDPHFNVMDGLDTYIDDYGQPDPLPEGMLRQMAQSKALGLFSDEPADDAPPDAPAAALATPAAPPDTLSIAQATPDEDAALRLQPHDAAGPHSAGGGPGPDPGRQC